MFKVEKYTTLGEKALEIMLIGEIIYIIKFGEIVIGACQ